MIDPSKDTRALFRSLLLDSLRDMGTTLSEDVEAYVVFLLDEMGRTPYVEDPLGIRLLGRSDQVVWKDVGDRALFVSGFFHERLAARGLSRGYYGAVSSSAYTLLSSKFPEPFGQLSRQVQLLQRALEGVRAYCDAMGMDVWRLHGEWLRCRSPVIERRLLELGLFVMVSGKA